MGEETFHDNEHPGGTTQLPVQLLLIEPKRDDAQTISELLAEMGRECHAVEWLTALDEGLPGLLGGRYDLCLLGADDGLGALQALLAAGVTTPVVLLSGTDDQAVERKAILSGASDYLVKKDLEIGPLARAIRQAIDRTRTIHTLRQSERLLRAALDGVGEAVIVIDDDRRIVAINAVSPELFGVTEAQLLGRQLFEFAADRQSAEDRWTQLRARGAIDGTLEFLRNDQRRTLEYRAVANIVPGRHVVICRDTTERENVETLQQRLVSIVESTDDAIIGTDCEGLVQAWNRGAERLFGWSAAEAMGRPVSMIGTPEQHPEQRGFIKRVLAGDHVHNHDTVRLARDGRLVPVSVSIARVDDHDGRPIGLSAIMRDITEVKATQSRMSAADRMASVGTLAAGVAHEINNPLTAVIANLSMLEERIDGPEELELVDEARQAAELVRQIVRDLKVFSRSDEQKRGPLALRRVVESSLRMAWNEVRHRARVVESYQETPLVDGNESRLAQVFLNLIVNAAQAIPDARAEDNEVHIATFTDGGGNAVVEVRDTGVGISPESLPHIFEPFFTTKPVGVGTGLGLAICDQIVHSMNGHIELESTPGKGTIIRVILPGLHDAVVEMAKPRQSIPLASRRGRVLVIDDEPVICRAVTRILSRAHDVVAVTSAERGLALLRADEQYDVILCDLMMPNMTGMDLHHALVESHPDLVDKLVFVTGGAFTERAIEFLDNNRNLRVDKPFDPIRLIALINERVG